MKPATGRDRLQAPEVIRFADQGTLDGALEKTLGDALRKSLTKLGQASLALSGGRTPRELYRRLCTAALDWQNVLVTLTDERWVATADPASNETMLRETLLQGRAAVAEFIPLKNDAPSAFAGQAQLTETLSRLPDRFTAVLLGMGEDGHIASLFPGANELPLALAADGADFHQRPCQAIAPGNAPHTRMTLTLPRLLASDRLLLYFTGADKWRVFQRALEPGPVAALPVRGLFYQTRTPVTLYWSP